MPRANERRTVPSCAVLLGRCECYTRALCSTRKPVSRRVGGSHWTLDIKQLCRIRRTEKLARFVRLSPPETVTQFDRLHSLRHAHSALQDIASLRIACFARLAMPIRRNRIVRLVPETEETEEVLTLFLPILFGFPSPMCIVCRAATNERLSQNLARRKRVDLSGCCEVKALPDGLTRMTMLVARGCTALTHLGDGHTRLKIAIVDNCIALTHVGNLPALTTLYAPGCRALAFLSDRLVDIDQMVVHGCRALSSIPPSMVKLELLSAGESGITSIPSSLVALRVLNCQECGALQGLPHGLSRLNLLRCGGSGLARHFYVPVINRAAIQSTGDGVPFHSSRVGIYVKRVMRARLNSIRLRRHTQLNRSLPLPCFSLVAALM